MSDTLESNKKHFSFKVTHVDKNSGARAGEIKNFTGISSPYEEPNSPELKIDTGIDDLQQCVDLVCKKLIELNIISDNAASK